MASESRMPESNPFVEIATHLFLEDIAAKVGISGLNNYLVSLAKNLAGSMPKEEYASWSEFLASAWVDGTVQLPEGPSLEALLKRAGISRTKLGMLMRNHSDVWLLEPA